MKKISETRSSIFININKVNKLFDRLVEKKKAT